MAIRHTLSLAGQPARWQIIAWSLAALVMVSLVTVFSSFITPEQEIWRHLAENLLPSLLVNALLLCVGVGCFTLMTRPFGWDTLAVKIYELTSEGEWVRAEIGIVPEVESIVAFASTQQVGHLATKVSGSELL